MNPLRNSSRVVKLPSERGAALVFFSMVLVLIVTVVAFVLDLGRTYSEKRRIQYATDAAALAGASYVGKSTGTSVSSSAYAAAAANGVKNSEVLSIECGRWIRGSDCTQQSCRVFRSCASGACTDCVDSHANAVRVQSRRDVGMSLAHLVGVTATHPRVESIAMVQPASSERCIKPFGIEAAVIGNKSVGQTFIVGKNAPGNWGKLSIGGVNYSSGSNFSDAILSDVGACGDDVGIGRQVPVATGNGGSIRNVFSDAIQQGKNTNWFLAVISPTGNGNGNVTILEFVTVTLISQTGSGNNWQATMRVDGRSSSPPSPPNSDADRFLVQ